MAKQPRNRQAADVGSDLPDEQYRIYFDEAPDYCYIIAPDGTIIDVNRAAIEALGYDKAELIGQELSSVYAPESVAKADQCFAQWKETGQLRDEELVIRSKDGQRRNVLLSATAARNESGTIIHSISIQRDITELRRAQGEMRFLSSVLQQTLDSIMVTDADFRITYMNTAACNLFGWTLEELQGKRPDVLNAETNATEIQEEIYRTVSSGGVWEGQALNRRKDGSTFLCHFKTAAIVDANGDIVGYVAVQRDITKQQAQNAQLALADRMACVGQLAAGVAHEINNPLTSVLYNLNNLSEDLPRVASAVSQLQLALGLAKTNQILGEGIDHLRGGGLEDLGAQAREAQEGADRIRRIVKDLTIVAQGDDSHTVLLSLPEVIEIAINMAYNQIKYRARLVKDLQPVPAVNANIGRLAQVFMNLLLNAAQAIEEGHPSANEIRIRTWTKNGFVHAEVRDTGKGIAKEHLGHIFEPFYTTKAAGVGAGLGLSIGQNVVRSFGGTIEVESTPERGSSFIVRLPIPAKDEKVTIKTATAPDEANRGRVLVIDDEPQICRTLSRLLAGEHHVEVASSGSAAIDMLRTDPYFDAIVCDFMMPVVSGMDIYHWLQKKHPHLIDKIVFISGGVFTPDAHAFVDAVDNVILDKPVGVKQLRAVLRQMITKTT